MSDQINEKLKLVTPIREAPSKYDIVWKDKIFKLDIVVHDDGFIVEYFIEEEIYFPDFIRTMVKDQGDKLPTRKAGVVGDYVRLWWWERCLGFKIENKIKKVVVRLRKELQASIKKTEVLEGIKKVVM